MNKKKKILYIEFFIVAAIISMEIIFNIWQGSIYYNEKRIAKDKESYSVSGFSATTKDIEGYRLTYSKISGDCLMWRLEPEKETEITFNYDSELYKGKFKVVLINLDKQETINILEGSEEGTKTIRLTGDRYVIKFVGKDAAGELEFSAENNKDIKVSNAS